MLCCIMSHYVMWCHSTLCQITKQLCPGDSVIEAETQSSLLPRQVVKYGWHMKNTECCENTKVFLQVTILKVQNEISQNLQENCLIEQELTLMQRECFMKVVIQHQVMFPQQTTSLKQNMLPASNTGEILWSLRERLHFKNIFSEIMELVAYCSLWQLSLILSVRAVPPLLICN